MAKRITYRKRRARRALLTRLVNGAAYALLATATVGPFLAWAYFFGATL